MGSVRLELARGHGRVHRDAHQSGLGAQQLPVAPVGARPSWCCRPRWARCASTKASASRPRQRRADVARPSGPSRRDRAAARGSGARAHLEDGRGGRAVGAGRRRAAAGDGARLSHAGRSLRARTPATRDRLRILELLEQQKITAAEAAELLAALGDARARRAAARAQPLAGRRAGAGRGSRALVPGAGDRPAHRADADQRVGADRHGRLRPGLCAPLPQHPGRRRTSTTCSKPSATAAAAPSSTSPTKAASASKSLSTEPDRVSRGRSMSRARRGGVARSSSADAAPRRARRLRATGRGRAGRPPCGPA